jgi:hypothetical protein
LLAATHANPSPALVTEGNVTSLVKEVRKDITAGSNIIGSVTIPDGTKVTIISVLDRGFMIKRNQSVEASYRIARDAVMPF